MSEPVESYMLAPGNALERVAPIALGLGVVALLACCFFALTATPSVLQSYLVAFLFWSGIPLGSLAILMLQHITGGAWGAALRRILEASTRTFPLVAVFFLPVLFGAGHLYEWTHDEAVAADAVLQHKRIYLNLPFFAARAGVYFAIWISLAHFLSRWSREQDGGDLTVQRRMENISRGGMLLFTMTMTFASVDWAMSLEPHWFSTIYGILFIGGQILSALAFAIPVASLLASQRAVGAIISPDRFHDLGKLLLAFVMVWAYFSFSQFLIIWSANLPEETPWYLRRLHSGWQWAAVALIVFHFALPFVLLLSRSLKRSRQWLMAVAMIVLGMRVVDLSWLILPAFERPQSPILVTDVLAFVGVGGVWMFFFVRQLRSRPLLPLHDDQLPEMEGVGA